MIELYVFFRKSNFTIYSLIGALIHVQDPVFFSLYHRSRALSADLIPFSSPTSYEVYGKIHLHGNFFYIPSNPTDNVQQNNSGPRQGPPQCLPEGIEAVRRVQDERLEVQEADGPMDPGLRGWVHWREVPPGPQDRLESAYSGQCDERRYDRLV